MDIAPLRNIAYGHHNYVVTAEEANEFAEIVERTETPTFVDIANHAVLVGAGAPMVISSTMGAGNAIHVSRDAFPALERLGGLEQAQG